MELICAGSGWGKGLGISQAADSVINIGSHTDQNWSPDPDSGSNRIRFELSLLEQMTNANVIHFTLFVY